MSRIDDATAALQGKTQILVFTGAGISTESGIPDFRGPDGVWTRVDPNDFTIDRFMASAEIRMRSWSQRGGLLDAEPNDAHRAVTRLWAAGAMVGCVTQNIDGLHRKAGLPDKALVEVHGTMSTTSCTACGHRVPTESVIASLGDDEPRCEECGGIIKVDTILFGEAMPVIEMARAFDMADRADAVLAVGTTLSVYPAASIPLEAAQRGLPFVIVNRGETELDDAADVVVEAAAGEALPVIVSALIDA